MRKSFGVLGLVVLLVGFVVGSAWAEDYPPPVEDVVEEVEVTPVDEVDSEVDVEVLDEVQEVAVRTEVLSQTGAEVGPLVLAGSALLLAGLAALLLIRRRSVGSSS